MILLVHMLFGAAVASKIKNPVLAVLLAFFGHYLLDTIPHVDYEIPNIKNKNWRKCLPDILKISLDALTGLILIFIFSDKTPIIFIAALFSIIPDALGLANLEPYNQFHEKIHFLKYKKISNFWRILTQIAIVIFSILALQSSFFPKILL